MRISEKKYDWCFIGQVEGKPTRATMLAEFRSLNLRSFEHITEKWNDEKQLDVTEYHARLRDSIVVPCPSGWGGAVGLKDCFRLYETLEAGSLPIIEHDEHEYFDKFFPGHPFLKAPSDWVGVGAEVALLLGNPSELQLYNESVLAWWHGYKRRLKQQINSLFGSTHSLSLDLKERNPLPPLDQSQGNKNAIYIVNAYDDYQMPELWESYCKPTVKSYAKKYNIDLVIYKPPDLNKYINRAYFKIDVIDEFIKSGYEKMVIMDNDIAITNLSPDIFEQSASGISALDLSPTHKGMWDYFHHDFKNQFYPQLKAPDFMMNSGVVVMDKEAAKLISKTKQTLTTPEALSGIKSFQRNETFTWEQNYFSYLVSESQIKFTPLDYRFNFLAPYLYPMDTREWNPGNSPFYFLHIFGDHGNVGLRCMWEYLDYFEGAKKPPYIALPRDSGPAPRTGTALISLGSTDSEDYSHQSFVRLEEASKRQRLDHRHLALSADERENFPLLKWSFILEQLKNSDGVFYVSPDLYLASSLINLDIFSELGPSLIFGSQNYSDWGRPLEAKITSAFAYIRSSPASVYFVETLIAHIQELKGDVRFYSYAEQEFDSFLQRMLLAAMPRGEDYRLIPNDYLCVSEEKLGKNLSHYRANPEELLFINMERNVYTPDLKKAYFTHLNQSSLRHPLYG